MGTLTSVSLSVERQSKGGVGGRAATVVRMVWNWHTSRRVDQWARRESRHSSAHVLIQQMMKLTLQSGGQRAFFS